jgi:outer membrane receptor for ferrienterochelin and colicins
MSVSLNEIRQIEVVKGPNFSLFGFNAESGVINIITYSAMKDNIDVAQVKVGTQQHQQVEFIHTAQFDTQAVRVSLGETASNGFDRGSMVSQDADNALSNVRANVDYEWQVDDSSNVRIQASHTNTEADTLQAYLSTVATSAQDTSSFHLNYNLDSDIGLWGVNVYRISDNFSTNIFNYENDLTVAKVDNLFKIGSNHSIRLAGEYRYNSLKGKIVGNGDSKFDYDLFAPSAMWDWKVSDNLGWTNSVRYDMVNFGRDETPTFGPFTNLDAYDRTIEEFSFNSGLSYKPRLTDTLRASVSRGLHIPSLIELGSSQSIAGLPVTGGFHGNPGLETERIMSYELAWDKKLPAHNANFRSAIFMQKAENVLGDTINIGAGPSLFFTFDNKSDSDTWGIELGLDGTYDEWLRWGVNYTYLDADDDNNPNLFNEVSQANHQITLKGGFDYKEWEFDADLHYISDSDHTATYLGGIPAPLTTTEEIEGYFVLNARAAYEWNDKVNLAIEGYNLVDKHREWLYTTGATGTDSGANTLVRSLLATLTYKY